MTNGTSQGLFVVVAIVIFGIFILTSYLLFRDNLKPTLANIFTDGVEQANCSLAGSDESNPICNPKFNNSHEFSSDGGLYVEFAKITESGGYSNSQNVSVWKNNSNQGLTTISISEYQTKNPEQNLIIENNKILMRGLVIEKLNVKNSFLNNGYQIKNNSQINMRINNDKDIVVTHSDNDNIDASFQFEYYLKIGQINTIKIIYINSYGGISEFDFQINIQP